MNSARVSLKAAIDEMGWPEKIGEELVGSAHVITYEKGAAIFHAGEPADLFYVLLSGEAKLYYGSAEGERLIVSVARRGQMLGLVDLVQIPLLEGEPKQLFTAEALSRCNVAVVAKSRVAATVAQLPAQDIAQLMRRLNDRWAQFCERFLEFMMMDVRSRLSYAIAELGESFGIPDARGTLISLKLTHDNFGELVGASRPMVSKHLKDLAKAGVFFKENGHYVLANRGHGPAAVGVKATSGSTTGRPVRPVRLVRPADTHLKRASGDKLGG